MGFKDKSTTETHVGTLIGEKSVIVGDINVEETTRIDGQIKGNVKSNAKLYIGTKGKITGNVLTADIMISGEIVGDITSTGRVEIATTGKVVGDINAKILVIDENAVFNGKCNMTGSVVDKTVSTSTKVEPIAKASANAS